jgi:hypothetical protein
VHPGDYLDDMEKRKFLTLPGLELRPLSRPARGQSLYRLSYRGSYAFAFIQLLLPFGVYVNVCMCQLSVFICKAILVVSSSQRRQFKGDLLQQMIHKMETYSGFHFPAPNLGKAFKRVCTNPHEAESFKTRRRGAHIPRLCLQSGRVH